MIWIASELMWTIAKSFSENTVQILSIWVVKLSQLEFAPPLKIKDNNKKFVEQ